MRWGDEMIKRAGVRPSLGKADCGTAIAAQWQPEQLSGSAERAQSNKEQGSARRSRLHRRRDDDHQPRPVSGETLIDEMRAKAANRAARVRVEERHRHMLRECMAIKRCTISVRQYENAGDAG